MKGLLTLCLLLASIQANAASINGLVVGVSDGDTITVLDENKVQHKIRLLGIDAPESAQAFGQKSKQSLADAVYKQQVQIIWSKQDQYKRTLGKVVLNGSDINLKQVQDGMAWHYKHYQRDQDPADRNLYSAAEESARTMKRGLWSENDQIAPWDFRRNGKVGRVESVDCGVKTKCSEMLTCEEAMRYLKCGNKRLDRDGDGIPCESICK